MEQIYYIMSADIEVAVVRGSELTILNEQLAPLFLKRTRNFEKWVSDRAIDSTRPNSRILKKAHGLSRLASDYETAMKYNAVSITDNFWVRSGDERWENVRFDSDLYFKAAVSSDNGIFDLEPSKSPELTNVGSREKGWKLESDGSWWLYKNEPLQNMRFEYLTSQIGRSLGFEMAYYELTEGMIRTRDITEGRFNLQHIDAIVFDHDGIIDEDLRYNYRTLSDIDPVIAKQYADMKYLDALVNNVDRHTKNYGLLTSQDDGHIIRLAPNYDNDMAFYGYPALLTENRLRGEMKDFYAFAGEIGYRPPLLDERELNIILDPLEDAERIKAYLLDGERLITGI